jgi:hypothetical protein
MDWIGVAGIVIGFAAIFISVYAIIDVRRQMRGLTETQYHRARTHTRMEMAWAMYIDPDPIGDDQHSLPVAKAMTELAWLTHQFDPTAEPKVIINAMFYGALNFADELVTAGKAKWKEGRDPEAIRKDMEKRYGPPVVWDP